MVVILESAGKQNKKESALFELNDDLNLYVAAKTIVGRRASNADNYLVVGTKQPLIAVYDGMGKGSGEEKASLLAAYLTSLHTLRDHEDFQQRRDAIVEYSQQVEYRSEDEKDDASLASSTVDDLMNITKGFDLAQFYSDRNEERINLDEVITLLLGVKPRTTAVAYQFSELMQGTHHGDSNLYRIRNNNIDQLTTPDNVEYDEFHGIAPLDYAKLERFLRDGAGLTSFIGGIKELETPNRNKVVIKRAKQKNLDRRPYQPGDTFIFCSDGLDGRLMDQSILDTVQTAYQNKNPAQGTIAAVTDLVTNALICNSQDNITAVVARVEKAK